MSNILLVNDSIDISGISLFNTLKFHHLHKKSSRDYYFCFVDKNSHPLAVARFLEKESGHFISPWKGTFGSFESAYKGFSLLEMEDFVLKVENYLKDNGAKRISLSMPPLVYNLNQSSWINILSRFGFTISNYELNYSLEVNNKFVDKLDDGNRKRLKKCITNNLSFVALAESEYEKAYNVLSENRAKKGITISMTWYEIKEMCDKLPEAVRFFGVYKDDELIASALCLHINFKFLYVFYWGEIAGVESLSPVTFLANGIYDFCLHNNIKMLDLGVSTLNSIPNYGLIRYKKNLGCCESLKLTMVKDL